MDNNQIVERIKELKSELRADKLDMSFGEIINLYENKELEISPEYQRTYRWKNDQRTRFIESLLLGIPTPPIFVAENSEGGWELVDGLQRISTVLSFFGVLKDEQNNNLLLEESNLIGNLLKDKNTNSIPPQLNLFIKRTACRVEILKWDSSFDMRYELFNRLNTGGSGLSEQEIRNCAFVGEFNNLLLELAPYLDKLVFGRDEKKAQMYLPELVLRYFAIIKKHNNWVINKNIPLYLTEFMKAESGNHRMDYNEEKELFLRIINFFSGDSNLFQGKQQFSVSHYDTVMFLANKHLRDSDSPNISFFTNKINIIKQDEGYLQYTGYDTGANQRFVKKLNRAIEIFDND
jgi:hypothetical protein